MTKNNNGYSTEVAGTVDSTSILNFWNLDLFSSTIIGGEVAHTSVSMENMLEDLLKDSTNNTYNISEDCSHTHTVHVQSEEKSSDNDNCVEIQGRKGNKKRGRRERGDNKEAVRKYREKLKTRETSLEDEIKLLKASNQQLLKRLEGEGALHDEILWLKCLLVDIKGRLEGETSSFRYRRPSATTTHMHTTFYANSGLGGEQRLTTSMLYGHAPNTGGSTKFN